MATRFSILAWRIPWTEEPGRLQSIGSQRVRLTEQLSTQHNTVHLASTFVKKTFANLVPEARHRDIYPAAHVHTHRLTHTHTHTHKHTLRVIDLQTNFYHIVASEDGSIKKQVLKLLKASFV